MKNLITFIIGFHLTLFNILITHAQVGIGTTTPNANALLDIDATNNKGGLLLPRVALINTTNPEPLTQNVAGMTVYNTATNGDVTPGFYCNDGASWIRLGAKINENWQTIGNTGTDPSTSFIGTTDAKDFVIKTNNNENIRLSASGNFGIGTNTPVAKTHISQTTGSDAILIDHSGTAGNSLEINQTNSSNTSSSAWIKNYGIGRGLNINQLSTGNSGQGLFINQNGTGTFSRGIEISMSNNNSSIGYSLFHYGLGTGSYISLSNLSNTETASRIVHYGLGRGLESQLTNPQNNAIGNSLYYSGLGTGHYTWMDNPLNTNIGNVLYHNGNGVGQYISMYNPASTTESVGLFVTYNGNNLSGSGGGGNAVEIQHNGINGNAVDIFIGDPSSAPGPSNTLSEYSGLTISHMATGTSSSGKNKSAISATNYSADPTLLVNNNGTEDGDGINVFISPASNNYFYNQATGIYAQAHGFNTGVGIYGSGGDVGVLGRSTGGSNFSFYGYGHIGASGAKYFHIDHPLDPENKTLSHYSIESNEVLNMYRGIANLGSDGKATINLPDYYSAVNINPSYQLTAIGTSTQPYISTEINNNKFIVSGKPGTKVSWTVYAERNDPTIQYYSKKNNMKENVKAKRPHEVGRYITPEAYGKNKTKGLWYNEKREQIYKERNLTAKSQKAMISKTPIKYDIISDEELKSDSKED